MPPCMPGYKPPRPLRCADSSGEDRLHGGWRPARSGYSAWVAPLKQLIKRALIAELTVFGFVGVACLVADIVLFNVFVFGVGMGPVPGKAIGLVITGAMAFFGHRHFTFRHRRLPGRVHHEVGRFVVATGATILLSLLPVYAARHVVGVTSVLGLNIANVVGIALGTAVRYLAYRYVVWTGRGTEGDQTVNVLVSRDDALVG
jgi:putative flippase GtrA